MGRVAKRNVMKWRENKLVEQISFTTVLGCAPDCLVTFLLFLFQANAEISKSSTCLSVLTSRWEQHSQCCDGYTEFCIWAVSNLFSFRCSYACRQGAAYNNGVRGHRQVQQSLFVPRDLLCCPKPSRVICYCFVSILRAWERERGS